jgi:predicted secreted protein
MIIGLFVLGLAMQVHEFGPSVVWRPPDNFRNTVLSACESSGAGFGKCFVDRMKAAGASAQALDFAHLIHDDGYVKALRSVGPVDAALVSYPFRANENFGLFLVNGEPPAIDIDDFKNLQQDKMKADAAYTSMSSSHPDATLWPGDRSSPDSLLALIMPDGSQQFVADYRIQAGCHACAVLGQAFFNFTFDSQGKFNGANFSGFTSKYVFSRVASEKMLRVESGSTWTVLLPANRTTGYSWNLAPLPNPAPIENTGHNYEAKTSGLAGSGGDERWTFHAAAPGETTLKFAYARPWEKNNPAKTLSINIRVQ